MELSAQSVSNYCGQRRSESDLDREVLNGDRSTVGHPKVVAMQQHHY
jgi:hypothetical protein